MAKAKARALLALVSTIAQVCLQWVKSGVAKLPASRVGQTAEDLLEVEITDPSGRAQVNRAGVLLGLIVCSFLLGKSLLESIGAMFDITQVSAWTLPYLVGMAVFTMLHTIVCTKLLKE